ncbi:MAG: hypothetical protein RJA36_882 [Pseudomonadota bacterium]|jgi:hypothetical protein
MLKRPQLRQLLQPGIVVLAMLPCVASAIPVGTIVKAIASRATTVAATFAVAHTVGGKGPRSGSCFDPGFSIFGVSKASCHNDDTFRHPIPPPTGDDHADANASASSSFFGGGGVSTKPTIISKGEFAAAGAYARTAANISIDAALPLGTPAAVVTFTLPGGDTYTARKDPETSFYGYLLSDLGEEQFDLSLLAHEVKGLSFRDYLPPSVQDQLVTPDNIYFAL